MAQSPPQYHNYPPYISPNSPTINYPPPEQYPPAKKARLSQTQLSPATSPQLTNGALPNPGFYAPQAPYLNGTSRQATPPSTQRSPGVGTMGPPNRPEVEKPVDVNELGDVMAYTGVDVREEENLLLGSHARSGQKGGSFGSIPSSSFNSVHSTSVPGYFDQYNYGHPTLSPNVPGDRTSFYGAGSLSQRPITPESFDEHALAAEKRAIRRRDEIRQYHLNDPFLQAAAVSEKLTNRCKHVGIKIEQPRAFGAINESAFSEPRKLNIIGPDNHAKIAVLKGKSLIAPPGGLTEVLTLLSLSCKDRIRTLLEDSATFAKGRRTTSNGVVPPEFVSMATGEGTAEEVTMKDASSASSLKRSFSAMDGTKLPTPESQSAEYVKTIAYPAWHGKALVDVQSIERSLEERRQNRRKERVNKNEGSRSGSVVGAPGPGTPGSLLDKGVDGDSAQKKPLTKKELKKQETSKATEAQQHAATNTAAGLALGRSGPSWLKGSGGTKSWMTSKSTTNTSFAPMPKKDIITPSKAATTGANAPKVVKTFGNFREDAVEGSGIQLRDVIGAMELDINEDRALSRAYGKINSLKD